MGYYIKMQEDNEVAYPVEQLDYCVSGRDLSTAGMTFAAQQTPAYNRYQITFSDRCSAGHAVRIAFYKALTKWQTVNTHVQEAADAYSEDKNEHVYYYKI
jgi:hypothetical protein